MDKLISIVTINKNLISSLKTFPQRKLQVWMASLESYIKHLREKEVIVYKLFLKIIKEMIKTNKKLDGNIVRKENSQAVLLMDMESPKLNISKAKSNFSLTIVA